MKRWLKRLLVLLTIPFITLVLTACPDTGENGDVEAPAIEDGIENAGQELEDAGEELENSVSD